MEIKAVDVAKLRKLTGAGMLDCKKALTEADGNIDDAIKIIREKGKAIASKRADREAGEGAAIAKTDSHSTYGAMIILNCETDFVAKNEDFVKLAESFLDIIIEKKPSSLDEVKKLPFENVTIADKISDAIAAIGEKVDLSAFTAIKAEKVITYIHPGNKIATLVGFNKNCDEQVAKDVAMQVAAMNPVAVDQSNVPQNVIDKEIEIGKEQARQEGKPEAMLEKIAMGKLNKFFKESTLLNQAFIKDNKTSVKQYLEQNDKELTVTEFNRFSLTD